MKTVTRESLVAQLPGLIGSSSFKRKATKKTKEIEEDKCDTHIHPIVVQDLFFECYQDFVFEFDVLVPDPEGDIEKEVEVSDGEGGKKTIKERRRMEKRSIAVNDISNSVMRKPKEKQ